MEGFSSVLATVHGSASQPLAQRARFRLAQQHDVPAGDELAGGLVEVAAGGHLLPRHLHQLGLEAHVPVAQLRHQVPVGRRAEGAALALAHHQQPHRHGLHAAGREARRDLLPQERREGVAHQPVEDAPRLLRAHEAVVDLAGVGQRLLDGFAGDLVEHHAPHRHLGLQHLRQVPRDALALAVLVGGEDELAGLAQRVLQLADDGLLVGRDDVQRLEVLLDVHAEAGPVEGLVLGGNLLGVARQVAHVAHRGLHAVARRQEGADGARLRRRLDDDQRAPALRSRRALAAARRLRGGGLLHGLGGGLLRGLLRGRLAVARGASGHAAPAIGTGPGGRAPLKDSQETVRSGRAQARAIAARYPPPHQPAAERASFSTSSAACSAVIGGSFFTSASARR